MLEKSFLDNSNIHEIGVDEAGRGPLFGRVYTAAVILPFNDDNFKYELMKDSKKFYSEKKIQEVANYIKDNSLYWGVTYSTEQDIDKYNILQATYMSMHKSIKEVLSISNKKNTDIKLNNKNVFLLIDGSYFKDFTYFDKNTESIITIDHKCITGGDNKYACIAAASILAVATPVF